jgi:polyisoprenoid-binding protein YceI
MMATCCKLPSQCLATSTGQPGSIFSGTWTIDPANSVISLEWREPVRTITGRLRGLGVIHVDELPLEGSTRFQQPSGLPVLTMTLDPASVETQDPGLNAMLRGADYFDAKRHPLWTLRSESLEISPDGTWHVVATLTIRGFSSAIGLHFDVDYEASSVDGLVMRGQGVLDRQTAGIGKHTPMLGADIHLNLAILARRAMAGAST